MSIETMTMFFVRCDLCGGEVGGDYVAWTDEDSAKLDAEESEWEFKNGKHYCPSHWICQAPQCHVDVGPLAGEFDYLCGRHQEST